MLDGQRNTFRSFGMSLRESLFIASVSGAMFLFAPVAAHADYAFCSVYSSSTRCDFQTYDQCQATVSGIGADCIANPAGPPAATGATSARTARQYSRRR
jgi:hypothetical protein